MAKCPTFLSVAADIAAGMNEQDAVKKAARELADWIDEQAFEVVCRELDASGWSRPRVAPKPDPPE